MDKALVSISARDLRAIAEVVAYLGPDERRNWVECGRPKRGHIYVELQRLERLLKANP